MTAGLQLGRPGVYRADLRPAPRLSPIRLDVAGFVGVALRGPVDTPVAVGSWSDFERRFGGLERTSSGRDRLLPYAVQAFFAQGGSRAWIVRLAGGPPAGEPVAGGLTADQATARFSFDPAGPRWQLRAADEGPWGSALQLRLDFVVGRALTAAPREPGRLLLPATGAVPAGSLCRIRRADLPVGVLRWAWPVPDPSSGDRLVRLDAPLPDVPDGADPGVRLDVVTGRLSVADPAPGPRRDEEFSGLGLHPEHPQFLPALVSASSLLLQAVGGWDEPLLPDLLLTSRAGRRIATGADRSDGIDDTSLFDPGPASADPLDELGPHRGVDAIGRVAELGILCVPDLTWRSGPAGPGQGQLDGSDPVDLAVISARQQRVVEVAELRRRFVALLDVPARLPYEAITSWRAGFDSGFAAAYHPWLGVPGPVRNGRPGPALLVPPSGFAAGILADRERRFGLSWGPANELAAGAVLAADAITDSVADQLHLLSINVFAGERDGFRLSAARTLSTDPEYRQLSVRRLMSMLAATIERQTQWLVFEPNTAELRARLTRTLIQLLRQLHRQGNFAGASEAQSFFVRCDDGLNPPTSQGQGRLVAEIGVAPAAPLEYLVLRISADVDAGLVVSEGGQEVSPGG